MWEFNIGVGSGHVKKAVDGEAKAGAAEFEETAPSEIKELWAGEEEAGAEPAKSCDCELKEDCAWKPEAGAGEAEACIGGPEEFCADEPEINAADTKYEVCDTEEIIADTSEKFCAGKACPFEAFVEFDDKETEKVCVDEI